MHDLEMEIVYTGTGNGKGWRMVEKGVEGPDRFNNPHCKNPDTIRWHAPKEYGASIVILAESVFERNGIPVADEIIHIPVGGKSEKLHIRAVDKGNDQSYEYGALVKKGVGDYTYVRGEKSPPGVVVGGKPPG